jgi:chaperone required for assembly of F1-ATPase
MSAADEGRKPAADADTIRRAMGGERRLPKRFYQTVDVTEGESGFGIALDGRPVRTPLKHPLVLPTRSLAEAIAAEWLGQDEVIDPANMPLTRLANTAHDRVAPRMAEIVAEIATYAGNDLVCYRAEGPDSLVLRQAQHWDPIVQRIEREIGGRFILVQGVIHHSQPAETIARLTARLERRDAFTLTGLHTMMTLTGSALIAEAVTCGFVTAETAWAAAHVDEDWQIEQWGADDEAAARRVIRQAEFAQSARFAGLAS